ncbi:MAG: FIG00018398: hypothetical regulator [uncultured Cytophagales bacterium]|uniref:FIG00018398: hypothetical regulator n=1 Tax=uncultured Cytophagales bacterium TaxID=158755 RepID=A0A6J4IBN4_9SPHI|nr:MAG: FIG00018398: hypothetical regulator [uncultured Cytophagales bacterium]
MHKTLLIAGALLGGLGVAIGAFGAHALRETLTQSGRTETFETAVKYQFYHALALLLVGILYGAFPNRSVLNAGYSMLAGVIVFSGSLYILCLTGLRWLGAVTPIGGVFMIIGWGLLLYGILRN